MVLHQKFKKIDILVFAGRELILYKTPKKQSRCLVRDVNLPLMPNADHVSTGIKLLCSKPII